MWGITESRERALHLQSYFVVFERPALGFLSAWLSDFKYLEDRDALIMRFEIGLSDAARKHGLRLGAWAPASDIDRLLSGTSEGSQHGGRGLNPTHAYWREIVLQAGAPYIKRDLIREFARFDDGRGSWRALLEKVGAHALIISIEAYLTGARRTRT
jgi:hypothetical protein